MNLSVVIFIPRQQTIRPVRKGSLSNRQSDSGRLSRVDGESNSGSNVETPGSQSLGAPASGPQRNMGLDSDALDLFLVGRGQYAAARECAGPRWTELPWESGQERVPRMLQSYCSEARGLG